MKPEWAVKLFLCGLLGGVSLLILNAWIDDSLLVCARQSDQHIDCMVSQINLLGEQHDGQEISHLKTASLELGHESNGRLSSASRVLLLTFQGEQIPLSSSYTLYESQPESAKIVAQVDQFLQSQESRLEISVRYMQRFFLLLPMLPLGLLLIIIRSTIKFKK